MAFFAIDHSQLVGCSLPCMTSEGGSTGMSCFCASARIHPNLVLGLCLFIARTTSLEIAMRSVRHATSHLMAGSRMVEATAWKITSGDAQGSFRVLLRVALRAHAET